MPSKPPVLYCLFWLWFVLLIFGLNSALNFISLGILLFAFVFFFLVDWILPRIGMIFKALVALILVHRTYYVGSFFDPRWLQWLAFDISKDMAKISEYGFGPVEPVTATALSLLAVLVLQQLYTISLNRGKAALLFLFAGSAVLAAAHLWMRTGSTLYIILYVIVGLIIMGTSRIQMGPSFPTQRWLSVLLIWVVVLSSVAWAMPEGNWELGDWWGQALTWNVYDPFAPPRGRVGYSKYDGSLGAPLEEDNTPALKVSSPVPVYLRGESRWQYTGNSWQPILKMPETYPVFDFSHLQGEEVSITVEVLAAQGNVIFAPRYSREIKIDGDNSLKIYTSTGSSHSFPYEEYEYKSQDNLSVGEAYTITALLPRDDSGELRQLSNTAQDARYLQLTHDIPQRVVDLAQEVTADSDNGYDKAMDLVRHLRRGEWDYSLNTQAPPQGWDFVDWFLFEQDRGYCVHFSTAFVIMARAVGLPARWVKGYSFGITDEHGNYIVQNRHAHSWAEVWFDGYGWVPFEPTPGAVLPTIREGGDEDPSGPAGPSNPADPRDPGEPDYDPGIENPGAVPEEPAAGGWLYFVLGGFFLLLMSAAIFLFVGRRWDGSIAALYARLQRRLKLFGWQRHKWETPREHLNRVQNLPDRPAFCSFVQGLEASVYGEAEESEIARDKNNFRWRFSVLRLAWHRMVLGRRKKRRRLY